MTTDASEQLRSTGLRVTSTRLAVLRSLSHGSHLAADSIVDSVREQAGTVSTQGVYNVLADLLAAGLIERIEPAGSPALYELARDHPHHHLICRDCHVVLDLECDHESQDCLTPPAELGFSDIEAEILFWGTCADCRTST
jgi:Fur family transcriptional regulator, stress-responsive regulator